MGRTTTFVQIACAGSCLWSVGFWISLSAAIDSSSCAAQSLSAEEKRKKAFQLEAVEQTKQALKYIAKRQGAFDPDNDQSNDEIGLLTLESINAMPDREAAYDLLSDWTFSGDGSLRSIRALVRLQPLPEWIPESVSGPYPLLAPVASPTLPIASSFHLLALLAIETNLEDDLMARLEEARAKGRGRSATALAIVLATRNKPVPEKLVAEVRRHYDSLKPVNNRARSEAPIEELQLASLLASDPKYHDFVLHVAVRMYDHAHPVSRGYLHPWYIRFLHHWGAGQTANPNAPAPSVDNLVHWMRSTIGPAKEYSDGLITPAWSIDATGGIEHLWGFGNDFLWYRYPLAGNFTIEAEFSDGGYSEGSLVCDGLRFNPHGNHNFIELRTQGTNDWVRIHSRSMRRDQWKKCSITLDDKFLSCRINNTLIYRENRKQSAQWVALLADGDKRVLIRNVRISGDPRIPRKVELIPDGNLRGWSGEYYDTKLPTHDVNSTHRENAATGTRQYEIGPSPEDLKNLAWSVVEGELVSGEVEKRGPGRQSCIQYERPIGDGETLTYEFFYEEGKTAVYPTIGRTAYILRPSGLHLHWMTAADTAWRIPTNFEVPWPANQLTPLSLKPGEWNQVKLKREGKTLKISLNGEIVFDGEAKTQLGDMVFGLFHYADHTVARVRNVALTGPWPEELPPNLVELK